MKQKLFTSRIKTLLIAAVTMAILTTVIVAVSGATTPGQNIVGTLLTPLRSSVAAIDRQALRLYNYVFSYEALKAENAALKQQIADMEEDIRTAEELQRENHRYELALGIVNTHEDYVLEPAYLISWDGSAWRSTFTIGKGERHGLQTGMAAITETGQLVGLLTDVGENWATVTTILDSQMEISASIASSGYTGVVEGTYESENTQILRMNYLSNDAVLKNNDQVVTTGSTLYPKGLLLGKITNVSLDETGVAKFAALKTTDDLENLEQIFVIKDYER